MRRILTIIFVIAIFAGIGVAIWFALRQTLGSSTDNGGSSFGIGGDAEPYIPPDVGVPVENVGEEVAPRLLKIADGPVAQGILARSIEIENTASSSLPLETDTEIRFVDRATGNLYRYLVRARVLERLTNRTLPSIYEAVWAKDGSRAFLRYIANDGAGERIETYALPADGTDGYVLETGLSDVIVSSTTVLTVRPSTTGTLGTEATLLGGSAKTRFSTLLTSLRLQQAGTSYVATTKASASTLGYGFYLEGDALTRLIGPLRGLSVLSSPSGSRMLYSSLSGTAFTLTLFARSGGEAVTLPVATLSEKCVFAVNEEAIYCAVPRAFSGTLPDDWYQGQVSFSDRLWKIDLTSRVASLIVDPLLVAETDIDAVSLSIDEESGVLVFTNKRDGSLWLYDL